MTTTGAIFQSGHNLASPKQLINALDHHKAELDTVVSEQASKVIGLTEQAAEKFREPLLDWSGENDWPLFHPNARGADECAILCSRPIKRQTYFLLTHKTLDAKVTKRTAPLFVVAAKPEDDDFFAFWHSPAHNFGLRPGIHATEVWLDAFRGLKRWRLTVGGEPTIGGDWNVEPDHNRRAVEVIDRRFPRMEWAGMEKQRPTQGGRVIDGLITKRRIIKRGRTLDPMPGFDHRGVLTVLG